MKPHKIGLALTKGLFPSPEEGFPILKRYGIDSTFTMVDTKERLQQWAELAAFYGIDYSSLHAPFSKVAKHIWRDDLDGEDAERIWLCSIDACANIHVPILVIHPFIGSFHHEPEPTEIGLARFRRLAEYAEQKGVRIALENVEGEAHLALLMNSLRTFKSIGFCLDTGHEVCYNRGKDMLQLYGDRLYYLHINSNAGVSSPIGEIDGADDTHWLPFDGAADMECFAARLSKLQYDGVLMMELKGPHADKSIYGHLSTEEYVQKAVAQIKRLRDMIKSGKGK